MFFPAIIERARAAEETGFDGRALTDHFAAPPTLARFGAEVIDRFRTAVG